jgi:hypothetical protein
MYHRQHYPRIIIGSQYTKLSFDDYPRHWMKKETLVKEFGPKIAKEVYTDLLGCKKEKNWWVPKVARRIKISEKKSKTRRRALCLT